MITVTGNLHTDDKKRCLSVITDKYGLDNIKSIHVVPLAKTERVEVLLRDGTTHKHYLKKKPCGSYEESELPGNDR